MKAVLVGNQNCGKTTLFNVLTNNHAKVGNWPGVTIEKKEGTIKETSIEIIDLPGIYSLNPYTLEENISRDYLFNHSYDIIINVVDVNSIERSLYLTTQLQDLGHPLILVLNMMDQFIAKGSSIDIQKLENKLKCKAIPISATKNQNIPELISLIKEKKHTYKETSKIFDHKPRYQTLQKLESNTTTMQEQIAHQRYQFIDNLKKECIKEVKSKSNITDKIDKFILNKWLAIPLFLIIMTVIYFLSIGIIGNLFNGLLNQIFANITSLVTNGLKYTKVRPWVLSLVVDGMLSGIFALLRFVPQIFALFFCIAILEASGYMNRIAFILDRLFKKLGLSGKTFIPFILGTSCSVPAIMACRTIENDLERKKAILLTPFIPCSAKLPMIALFSSYFFAKYAWLVSVSLYFIAILVIITSAWILKKYLPSSKTSFIIEIPKYQIPVFKNCIIDSLNKSWHFIKKTGTIILACNIIAWFLLSFTFKLNYIDGFHYQIDQSIMAFIGKSLSWFFYPILGKLNWVATVSCLQGLIAKEQIISSLSIIQNLSQANSISNTFSPISAYSFIVYNLFSAPCINAIIAMKNELGNTKTTSKIIIFQTGIAWIFASIVFIIGSLII